MRRQTRFAVAYFGFAVFALGAANAWAQLVNPFGRARAEFTKGDLMALRAELWPLLDKRADGTVDAWRNPQTGNVGTMQIDKSYQWKGLRCRTVTHVVRLKAYKNPRRFVVSYCKTADAVWKIAP